jgi:hypothetical protein
MQNSCQTFPLVFDTASLLPPNQAGRGTQVKIFCSSKTGFAVLKNATLEMSAQKHCHAKMPVKKACQDKNAE